MGFGKHHLWYLSGSYDKKGGEVLLTKEPGKYSNWEFVASGKHSGEVTYYFIKNTNDLGKDAWLTVGPPVIRYKGSFEVMKAELSFDEKQEFGVEDAESGK